MPVTEFLWDPVTDCVLDEYDGSGNLTVEYAYEPVRYGRLVSEDRGGQQSYYHPDVIGSTRLLTNQSQTVTDTFAYDAWGNDTLTSGSSTSIYRWIGSFGYTRNALTNLTDVRARKYTPALSLWTSVDPLMPGKIRTPFVYAINSPLLYNDPSGEMCHATQEGMQYIPNRGFFAPGEYLGSFTTPESDYYSQVGTTARFKWKWEKGTDKFLYKCGCCCSRIGFLQIAKTVAKWAASGETKEWFIDGGIPYHKSDAYYWQASPCLGVGDTRDYTEMIQLEDQPSTVIYNSPTGYLNRLDSLSHDFETCVVCLDGIEGIRSRLESVTLPSPGVGAPGYPIDEKRISGITVYGCLTWSHFIKWSQTKRDYVYTRSLDSLARTVTGTNQGATVTLGGLTAGKAPSANFWSVVNGVRLGYVGANRG